MITGQTELGWNEALILVLANAELSAALGADMLHHNVRLLAWDPDGAGASPYGPVGTPVPAIVLESPDIGALRSALRHLQLLPNAKGTPLIVLLPPTLMHEASHYLSGWNHEMLISSTGKDDIVKHVLRHLRTQAILSQAAVLRAHNAHAATLIDPEAKAAGAAERLRIGQSRLLEMIAKGQPLKDTLRELTLLIESQHEGLYCSVMLWMKMV